MLAGGRRRSVLVRGSFVLNVLFALYVLLHVTHSPSFITPPTHENYTTSDGSSDSGDSVQQFTSDPEAWGLATPSPSLQERIYPDLHSCRTPILTPRPSLNGNYWVLQNYVPSDSQPACNESVTYTTHADFTFLDNLVPLVDRWRGPISVASFAPGGDFAETAKAIAFLRSCRPLVATHVTFHVFFPTDHMPEFVPSTAEVLSNHPSCSAPPPFLAAHTYKKTHNLTYPVNIARNIARQAAATYFVLASDIELYPSTGMIPTFLEFMQSGRDTSRSNYPMRRVYVLPIFEVKSGLRPPATKPALVRMLKKGYAIPFHKFVCPQCHLVPGLKEWATDNVTEGLSVVKVAKRHHPYNRWEPIYIGTHLEPLYEERLTWEGRSDKMTQMYVMCVLDYEFHILNNGFLVHRPGIKRLRKDERRDLLTAKQNDLINKQILSELHVIYGKKPSCYL